MHGMLPKKSDRDAGIHGTIGQALIILYVVQLVIGLFIHYVKFPSLFGGRRPPQNYIHVLLGITILALSAYNVSCLTVHPYAHISREVDIFCPRISDVQWSIHRMVIARRSPQNVDGG